MKSYLKNYLLFFFLLGFLGGASVQTLNAQSETPISYTNAARYFSPNFDGVKDVLTIPFVISEDGKLVEWRITIYQRLNEKSFTPIKIFSLISEGEGDSSSLRKSLKRLFIRDYPVEPPGYVEWNGANETGVQFEDGVYYLEYYGRDEAGNSNFTDLYPIVIDTLIPEASLSLDDDIFSPNGDGVKEEITGTFSSSNLSPLDMVEIIIINNEGEAVFSTREPASSLATTFSWDGLMENNREAPEGIYTFAVKATDYAGNESLTESSPIRLVREFETANLSLSLPALSPNGDGFFDTLTIDSSLSSEEGLTNWEILITSLEEDRLMQSYSGESDLKSSIFFNGRDSNNELLVDGTYVVSFSAGFSSGNSTRAEDVSFIVDTAPPEISAEALDTFFNPGAREGGIDSIRIRQTANGEAEDRYTGTILDESEQPAFSFPETVGTLPEEVVWDGQNQNEEVLPGLYRYQLSATDPLSNVATVITEQFELISELVEVRVVSRERVFSPNRDAIMEETEFLLAISETYRRLLSKGSIEIFNERKRLVHQIDFEGFTNRFPWEGQNANGDILPDGKYLYRAKTTFQTSETLTTPYRTLYLDTTPPNVIASVATPIFSPNNDGNLDTFLATNTHTPSAILPKEDIFQIQIQSENGTVVREKEWTGDLPNQINWTGVNDISNASPEGNYFYQLSARDIAGNKIPIQRLPFTLVRELETLDLSLSTNIISFNPVAGSDFKSITVTPSLSSTQYLENLNLHIVQQDVETLLITQSNEEPFRWSTEGERTGNNSGSRRRVAPSATGATFGSGIYELSAEAKFASGNVAKSRAETIIIDNDPPIAQLRHEPKYFSPDGNNEREILNLGIRSKDNHKVVRTEVNIFRRVQFEKSGDEFPQSFAAYSERFAPFKSYSWEGPFEDVIIWDGIGEDGSLVESANDYVVFLETEDAVGLKTLAKDTITVDIFVEELADGRLRIVINSINFRFDSARMVGDSTAILDRLAFMLSRFPEYRIEVLGHTDSQGSEAYNQRLSERRAETVFNALTDRGVSAEIMTYTGAGETQLLIPNETVEDASLTTEERTFLSEENYRRNRRVEFYLQRPEDAKSGS